MDLVARLFGGISSWLAKMAYVLIGLSAIFELMIHKSHCRTCTGEGAASAM